MTLANNQRVEVGITAKPSGVWSKTCDPTPKWKLMQTETDRSDRLIHADLYTGRTSVRLFCICN